MDSSSCGSPVVSTYSTRSQDTVSIGVTPYSDNPSLTVVELKCGSDAAAVQQAQSSLHLSLVVSGKYFRHCARLWIQYSFKYGGAISTISGAGSSSAGISSNFGDLGLLLKFIWRRGRTYLNTSFRSGWIHEGGRHCASSHGATKLSDLQLRSFTRPPDPVGAYPRRALPTWDSVDCESSRNQTRRAPTRWKLPAPSRRCGIRGRPGRRPRRAPCIG